MQSAFAMTFELVDMELAACELVDGISGLTLEQSTIGVLFCDSELEDHAGLLQELKSRLDFEIVGCTTLATLNTVDGISEMSTGLLVITAGDCRFSVAISKPVTPDTAAAVVEETYREAAARLEGAPVMMLAYPPHEPDIVLDLYPQVLTQISGGVPVFGGTAGYNRPYGVNAVIMGGRLCPHCMLLVLMEGNLRPLFATAVEMSHLKDRGQIVTRSQGNVLYEVDGRPATEFLESAGIDTVQMAQDETRILLVTHPLRLTRADLDAGEYALVRNLYTLNLEEGSATAVGLIPQGHHIAVGSITRGDIRSTAERSVRDLLAKIEEAEAADPSYRYSTILASSCLGRYMVMTPDIDLEGAVFKELLPPHISFMGYYGYGEIGPTSIQDGKALNTAQNESITLCAF